MPNSTDCFGAEEVTHSDLAAKINQSCSRVPRNGSWSHVVTLGTSHSFGCVVGEGPYLATPLDGPLALAVGSLALAGGSLALAACGVGR